MNAHPTCRPGAQLRLAAGHLLDRGDRKIGERAGFCDEHVGIRWLPHDARAAGCRTPFIALRRVAQRLLGVESLKRMLNLARAWPGMTLPALLPTSTEVNSRFEAWNWALPWSSGSSLSATIRPKYPAPDLTQMRIGDMALDAVDIEHAVQRAAAADLDAVAEYFDVAGFPSTQWSNFSPRAAAHCSSLMVPLTEMSPRHR